MIERALAPFIDRPIDRHARRRSRESDDEDLSRVVVRAGGTRARGGRRAGGDGGDRSRARGGDAGALARGYEFRA